MARKKKAVTAGPIEATPERPVIYDSELNPLQVKILAAIHKEPLLTIKQLRTRCGGKHIELVDIERECDTLRKADRISVNDRRFYIRDKAPKFGSKPYTFEDAVDLEPNRRNTGLVRPKDKRQTEMFDGQ